MSVNSLLAKCHVASSQNRPWLFPCSSQSVTGRFLVILAAFGSSHGLAEHWKSRGQQCEAALDHGGERRGQTRLTHSPGRDEAQAWAPGDGREPESKNSPGPPRIHTWPGGPGESSRPGAGQLGQSPPSNAQPSYRCPGGFRSFRPPLSHVTDLPRAGNSGRAGAVSYHRPCSATTRSRGPCSG
jgi:hypothetical protein